MALEGTIKDFGLPDIFQLIGLQRKTGHLTLKTDKEHVTVTFENGMVVAADSANKRIEDRLGNVLVKQGKLSKERLDEALATQKATLQRLGHILVTHNFISGQDLKQALQVQVSQMVFKVFRWRDGTYHFAPADTVDYDRDNFNPMSADFILMEGIRMVDEWPIIEKKIPSMDIVFRPAIEASQITSAEGEGGEEGGRPASSKISLTPEEERVFRRVDGTRTVQGVIDASGLGDFDTCRILFDLLNRNLVTTAGKGVVAKASEAGPIVVTSPGPGYAALAVAGVLALVGLFLHLSAPFGVLGLRPLLGSVTEQVRRDVGRSRLERLDAALGAFRLAKGSLPSKLEDLAAQGLLDRRHLVDPWSRAYKYALTQGGYRLSAVSASGQELAVIERDFAAQP